MSKCLTSLAWCSCGRVIKPLGLLEVSYGNMEMAQQSLRDASQEA